MIERSGEEVKGNKRKVGIEERVQIEGAFYNIIFCLWSSYVYTLQIIIMQYWFPSFFMDAESPTRQSKVVKTSSYSSTVSVKRSATVCERSPL